MSDDLLEKIRQQFNFGPYPRVPLEESPQKDVYSLYIHNFATSYYLRNHRVPETAGRTILDVGCGTGYKSLVLAAANPGARVIGIDISEESIQLAQERGKHHGFDNAEFYASSIESLPDLDIQFDYINCDEILYLFDDLSEALKVLKRVLKPTGIIRGNLHSSLQRFQYFRAQEIFRMMGLLDSNPEDLEIDLVIEIMQSLKDSVDLKRSTWTDKFAEGDQKKVVLMNYLLQGDKGYTIRDLFQALRDSQLEFVSMVNWRFWELTDLFKEADNLPAFLAMSLPEISIEERLRVFELLQPIHRLLDFWCTVPQPTRPLPLTQWTEEQWQLSQVHLHPQLKTKQVKVALLECVRERKPFQVSSYLPGSSLAPVVVESSIAANCLLPLWEGSQSFETLVKRWQYVQPLHPVTLKPIPDSAASNDVKTLLIKLETFLYVMVESAASSEN